MDKKRVKEDLRRTFDNVEQAIDVIVALQEDERLTHAQLVETTGQLETAKQRIQQLEERIAQLEKDKPDNKLDEPYSMKAEEKRQEKRGKAKKKAAKPVRRGRRTTDEKIQQAKFHRDVYPAGVPRDQCKLSHKRPVWRLEKGQAILVAYHVYRAGNQYGRIPFTMGRSEFGLEFIITIAHMVYTMGIPFDKTCALLQFFQGLRISKSQANALMNQLARQWEGEFEIICTLLAHAAVVHADETSWSIKSVWGFLSEQVNVFLFGVNKDAQTLAAVLDKTLFEGSLVSDDANVYQGFSKSQKCWAHLLRKAIKLTLQDPENAAYREFADALLALYHKACRVKRDGRYTDATRQRKAGELKDELLQLCVARWWDETPGSDTVEDAHRLLANELVRLALDDELFTFVTTADVSGTNNDMERELRPVSGARDTGRGNKPGIGCRRQSVIYTVLSSLKRQLSAYTLESVVTEVQRWWSAGRSCFRDLLDRLGLSLPEASLLDELLPPDTS